MTMLNRQAQESRSSKTLQESSNSPSDPHSYPPLANARSYLATAERIGARLCRDALWARDRCNWVGSSMEVVDHSWAIVSRSFGPDLYSGTSGIALFLGRLFQATKLRQIRRAALGAMAHALSRLSSLPESVRLGLYSGGAGVLYAMMELAPVLDRSDWVDRAVELVEQLARLDLDTVGRDLISGSAGAIPVLLAMHARHASELALQLAQKHGHRLLNDATRHEFGWSWETLPGCHRHLTGLSHGASGVAWALLELHAATGEASFREGAVEGFRYEQHWFDVTHENWPDFREANSIPGTPTRMAVPFTTAWCHGAPGIGMARLRAFQLLAIPEYFAHGQAALRSTIRWLSDPNTAFGSQCLCHGALGNAELLLCARELLGIAEHDPLIAQVADSAVRLFENSNTAWPCGVLGGGETPGLMLGLAGIAHFYLRLSEPGKFSAVLLPTASFNHTRQ